MKIIYHQAFNHEYNDDPAASEGRMECIFNEIRNIYEFIEPAKAKEVDLSLVHTKKHIDNVKRLDFYNITLLAVGGAIKSAELAYTGEPAFALIRPPGHHASQDSSWGFCYFNNIAISIQKLRKELKIKKVIIIDIDLHYGDGTSNIFNGNPDTIYFSLPKNEREQQIKDLKDYLSDKKNYDILAVSAGFDRHIKDWGRMLETQDYLEIGKILRDFSIDSCKNKRFAVLEGGYNHKFLGLNVKTFLKGFQ